MNFCGAEYDAHLDQATKVSSATLCGPCVKDENLEAMYTDDEDEEFDGGFVSESIRQEEEKKIDSDDSSIIKTPSRTIRRGSLTMTPGVSGTRSNLTPPSTCQRMGKLSDNSTPSPIYLNPMAPDDWDEQQGKTKSSLLCPRLEPSNTMDKLLERLIRGFHVGVCREGSKNARSPALLYLNEANRTIDLTRVNSGDDALPWCSFPVDKILRLEIKGKNKGRDHSLQPACPFTIIVNQDSTISYYDFEVETSIERELIVSTLMIVLDRMRKDVKGGIIEHGLEDGDSTAFGGTEDQPIPCSPSLEQQHFDASQSTNFHKVSDEGGHDTSVIHLEDLRGRRMEEQSRAFDSFARRLPRRRNDHFRSKSSSPKSRREKLYRQKSEGYGYDDHGVHMRPIKVSFPSTGRSRLRQSTQDIISSPRESPHMFGRRSDSHYRGMAPVPEMVSHDLHRSSSLQSRNSTSVSEVAVQPNAEDLIVEFAASGHLSSPWCTDDTCSLALKDFADTCSNIFVSGQPRGSCSIPAYEQQRMLEEYIASALGAPSAFYSFFAEGGEQWTTRDTDERNHSTGVNARVRNRSGVLNAQARRFRRLRGEMTFSAALKKSQEVMPYIQTTRSFNDETIYRRQALQVAEEGASLFHSSGLLQHVVGRMRAVPAAPSEDDVVYYDSDPEDARSHSLYRKCPRQVAAQLQNQGPAVSPLKAPAPAETGFAKIKSIRRVSKKLEEDVIVQIVQTMTNDRMTLIWHPTQTTEGSNRCSPLCVKFWIESGVCLLDGTFVLPKLSWTRVIDKTEGEMGAKSSRRLAPSEPRNVDLLDICRVFAVEKIDRAEHPFADARKSFFVETQAESFVFEALTAEERNRIVYGLKLVIARLASMLMLRDARAAEEFFGAVVPSVPGEAPEWAQGSTSRRSPERLLTVPDDE